MRSTLFIAATVISAFFLAAPVSPQTSAQNTPQALQATYDQAMKAKDWAGAIAAAQQLVDANATSANLLLLANAQLYATTGQSDTGPLETALATYDRALAAAQQEKPAQGQPDTAWKDGVSKIYVGRGNALLKLKRTPEAIESYNHSAELSSNPGLAYFNVCAVLYNIGDTGNSAAACRKCVQADPTRANAWFVLGSDLFADAPVSSAGKVTITVETRQALEKYLELAPDGPHAADTKAMLQMAAP
ncbi:MAG: tetratricopeptide repeat protein [Terracidiphilus sp.]|jgi:tetratricopeptide (TPR) repeat protein